MTTIKTNCTWPDCTCPHSGRGDAICEAEEAHHGKQLSFGERVTLEDGIDHAAQAKDEGRTFSDFLFAFIIMVIIIGGAIGSGLYYAIKNTYTIPATDFVSRRINVELDGVDTVKIIITDKFIYHYNTLNDGQKKELLEGIK